MAENEPNPPRMRKVKAIIASLARELESIGYALRVISSKRDLWFDAHGWLLKRIPADCVRGCAHAGQCDDDVKAWRASLNFFVPRTLAIEYLKPYGAWNPAELAEKSNDEIADIVLWLACNDLKETGEYFGLIH